LILKLAAGIIKSNGCHLKPLIPILEERFYLIELRG